MLAYWSPSLDPTVNSCKSLFSGGFTLTRPTQSISERHIRPDNKGGPMDRLCRGRGTDLTRPCHILWSLV